MKLNYALRHLHIYMRHLAKITLLSSLAILFVLNPVQAKIFTRVLQFGSVGADVRILQQFLNSDADTQIAISGAGSPGLETTKFGPATKVAVQKFQLKYALIKKGASGYGLVGPKTRAKLEEVFAGIEIKPTAASKPKPKPQTVIRGELAGIAPDKTEFNVKSGTKRFDYTILLDQNTVFLDKNGAPTIIDNFGFGDTVEVRGHLEKAYTIRAAQVKDLTSWKIPIKQTTMTITDLSLSDNEVIANDGTKEWHIKIQSQTTLMNIDRTTIMINDLSLGDTIYVAGVWDQRAGVIFGSVVQKK